jgi:hypothetical protein
MRTLLYVLPAIAIVSLAFWAYSENFETQKSLQRVRDLQRQIGARHETLAILKAEWAYLNRPERLRELAAMNYDRLQLLPLMPEHFARVGEIAYPGTLLDPQSTPISLTREVTR